jgi:hypothetical protein
MTKDVSSITAKRAQQKARTEARYRQWAMENAATGHPAAVSAFTRQNAGGLRVWLRQSANQAGVLGKDVGEWVGEIQARAIEDGKTEAAAFATAALGLIQREQAWGERDSRSQGHDNTEGISDFLGATIALARELYKDRGDLATQDSQLAAYLDAVEARAERADNPGVIERVNQAREVLAAGGRESLLQGQPDFEADSAGGYKGFVSQSDGSGLT